MTVEVKKPSEFRAQPGPSDGYVVTADGKLKTRYEAERNAATIIPKYLSKV